jgi:hypothetical protein
MDTYNLNFVPNASTVWHNTPLRRGANNDAILATYGAVTYRYEQWFDRFDSQWNSATEPTTVNATK